MAQATETETYLVAGPRSRTSRVVKWAVAMIVLGGIGAGTYMVWNRLRQVESTDDAQIDGTIVPVSSRVGGYVIQVLVGDQQYVKAGETLVQLDKRDYDVAVARARANLADAQAALRGAQNSVPVASISTASALSGARSAREDAAVAVSWAEQQLGAAQARLKLAEANVRVALANRNKADQDVIRYKGLVEKDEISKQNYDQVVAAAQAAEATVEAQQAAAAEARQNVTAAEKAVDQARAKLQQADAAVEGARVGPSQVKLAEAGVAVAAAQIAQKKADLDQAELNLSYSTIAAPVEGIVGRKAVDPGQNIAAGQQLMSIVNLDDIWVTANFKETQLKNMRIGQKVDIEVDGNGRTYTGKIERISGASGARFSLLPPENATGNFVKVVQRIPVRISIDPGQNGDHALRPGMSVTPKVHVRP
ncbi:MAG TPA: HlyD family secretion protein [Bryobacteraceae bacterium]|nr:HlyD family secretion protein [Bryobacteraceae bacterium]